MEVSVSPWEIAPLFINSTSMEELGFSSLSQNLRTRQTGVSLPFSWGDSPIACHDDVKLNTSAPCLDRLHAKVLDYSQRHDA